MIAAVLIIGCGSRVPHLPGEVPPLLEFRLVHIAPSAESVTVEYEGSVLHLDSRPVISDTDIVSVADPVEQERNLILSIELGSDGAVRLARITGENIGSRMALLIDGQIVSAPVIQSEVGMSSMEVAVPRAVAESARLSSRVRARWPADHDP